MQRLKTICRLNQNQAKEKHNREQPGYFYKFKIKELVIARLKPKPNRMTAEQNLQPTTTKERINSLDIIRGIALFGILLMNIVGFGLYKAYYDPTNSGGATGWDLKVWWINNMFFEGTMRGLFSMLFGAGIVLFNSRTINGLPGIAVTDAYFRRTLWLLVFGVIHAYLLLWAGEILFPYAVIGLIAYSFRNLHSRKLIIAGLCFSIGLTALNVKDYYQTEKAFDDYTIAEKGKTATDSLSKENKKAIAEWETIVAEKKGTPEAYQNLKKEFNKGYLSIVWYRSAIIQVRQSLWVYRLWIWDVFSMVLLGMAFFKNGIFKAEKSNRYYLLMMLAGYLVGISVNYWETSYLLDHNFSVRSFFLTDITHELGRVPTTIGHIGFIMLFIKSGTLPFLQRSLAAVGQMAFSNYIMHTIICITIFMGFGFGMWGKFQRHELYYIVFSIWIFQLILSPLWLKYFRFGPLEWLWRSLTYWKIQPFKK